MMKEPDIDEVVARRFLLGQLSPEEQGQIEELAFEDPDTFTLLESVEVDLMDEFLHDELSPLEKQGFEHHFLTFPGRRQELEISESLQKRFDEIIPPDGDVDPDDDGFSFRRFIAWLKQSSFQARAITAAVLFTLLMIVVWLVSQDEKQPDPVQVGPGIPVNVPNPEPRISPPLQPSPSPVQAENKRKSHTPEKQKPVATYVLILVPSSMPRSPGGPSLQLPPDGSTVAVALALPDWKNFKSYDVTLADEAGTELDRWTNRKVQHFPATERFPAIDGLLIEVKTASLKPGEFYRIGVTGLNAKGERSTLQGYPFEAKK